MRIHIIALEADGSDYAKSQENLIRRHKGHNLHITTHTQYGISISCEDCGFASEPAPFSPHPVIVLQVNLNGGEVQRLRRALGLVYAMAYPHVNGKEYDGKSDLADRIFDEIAKVDPTARCP